MLRLKRLVQDFIGRLLRFFYIGLISFCLIDGFNELSDVVMIFTLAVTEMAAKLLID